MKLAAILLISSTALLEGIALAQSSPAPAPAPATDGDLALIQSHCALCHEIGQVTSTHKTEADWIATVDRMVGMGAEITPDEKTRILAYLKTHNGPPAP